jgi:hypothetical protein
MYRNNNDDDTFDDEYDDEYDDQLDPLRTGSIFRADLKSLRTPEVARKFNLLVHISPVPKVLHKSISTRNLLKSLASRRQSRGLDLDLDLRKRYKPSL